MKLRVHAQLDYNDIKSLQDAYYLTAQILGMKIMNKFGAEYEMEYGMDMVVYRNRYGSVVLSVSTSGVKVTISANGKREDLDYNKDESLDNISENVAQTWRSMLSVEQVA